MTPWEALVAARGCLRYPVVCEVWPDAARAADWRADCPDKLVWVALTLQYQDVWQRLQTTMGELGGLRRVVDEARRSASALVDVLPAQPSLFGTTQ